MPESRKLTKKETNYRRSAGARRCGNCSMFRPDRAADTGYCTFVAGTILAQDVCDEWEAQKGAA